MADITTINRNMPVQLTKPQNMLESWISKNDPYHALEMLCEKTPAIWSMIQNMAVYLTDRLPGPFGDDRRSSLFDCCLSQAMNEWEAMVNVTNSVSMQQTAFIRGMFSPLTYLQNLKVENPASEQVWSPLDMGLGDWILDQDAYPIITNSKTLAYWTSMMSVDFRTIVVVRHIIKMPEEMNYLSERFDWVIGR